MKSVKIGRNTAAENIYKSKHHVAEKSLHQAKTLVYEIIPSETLEKDIELFKQSFVEYTSKYIKQDNVLKHIATGNFIPKFISEIRTLEKRYKEYRQPDKANFDIFATTEYQVKCFDYSLKLCELLNNHPQQSQLNHQLRNTIIPLVTNNGAEFTPDAITISMLK